MATVQSPRISCINWLDEGPLAPHGQAYKQYLVERACAASTFGNCLGGVAHFVQWLGRRRVRVRRIDEAAVAEFLNEHPPRCDCAEPAQRDRRNCSAALRIAGRLLSQRFGDDTVDISAIKAEHVRRFFAQQAKLYSKPASAATVVAALRGYFRYRASLGDAVHRLIGAVSYQRRRAAQSH